MGMGMGMGEQMVEAGRAGCGLGVAVKGL